MSTSKKRAGELTPAVYRFLSQLVRPQELGGHGLVRAPGDAEFYFTPPGTTGTRVTNNAVRLQVITLVAGYIATIDKVRARMLLRQHDKGTLPEGVYVHMDGRVTDKAQKIGEVIRSGAGRGMSVRWSAALENHPATIPGTFENRIDAGRAICRVLGYTLPGEGLEPEGRQP